MKRTRETQTDRQTQAKRLREEGGRDKNDATISQGISKTVGDHQKLGEVS